MPTLYAKKFQNTLGKSVHALNTACVALSILPDHIPQQADLKINISWSPKDIDVSVRISRSYFIRAMIIYVAEGFLSYLKSMNSDFFSPWRGRIFGDDDKPGHVCKFLKEQECDEVFSVFTFILLILRNKIVHGGSKKKLTDRQQALLIEEKDNIHRKFSGLDVTVLLENFEKAMPTLKEASSLVRAAIKIVQLIDSKYIQKMDVSNDNIQSYIDLDENKLFFSSLLNEPCRDTVKRKLTAYLNTHAPHLVVHVDEFMNMVGR